MITFYNQQNNFSRSLEVYQLLLKAKETPNAYLVAQLLSACKKRQKNSHAIAIIEDVYKYDVKLDGVCMKVKLCYFANLI